MKITYRLLTLTQLIFFLISRILYDLAWYLDYQVLFISISIGAISMCVIIKIIRQLFFKYQSARYVLLKSQLYFFITWTLTITTCVIFIQTFKCGNHQVHSSLVLTRGQCVMNVFVIFLTNLNYSLICNIHSQYVQLVIYQVLLFAQIIFNGRTLIYFIDILDHQDKQLSILLVSIMIANQVLIMDLLFRASHLAKQLRQSKQKYWSSITQIFRKKSRQLSKAQNIQIITSAMNIKNTPV